MLKGFIALFVLCFQSDGIAAAKYFYSFCGGRHMLGPMHSQEITRKVSLEVKITQRHSNIIDAREN